MNREEVFSILGNTCLSPDKWKAYEQSKRVIFHYYNPMPFEYEITIGHICEYLGI